MGAAVAPQLARLLRRRGRGERLRSGVGARARLGGALVAALRDEAEQAGIHKLLGKLFTDNAPSRRLVARHGFREVGTHLRHGRLDGEWRDVVLVELLLGEAAD